MHIYAFGSVCRGEIELTSDVDLLAIVDGVYGGIDPDTYSIYSYERIKELWNDGNPFAWHLALEAKNIYSSDGSDFIQSLGKPKEYTHAIDDCKKFHGVFCSACESLNESEFSNVFDLSSVFLGVRNFATCYSLGFTEKPNFSRHSALNLERCSLDIEKDEYDLLVRCRVLCTRGIGEALTSSEIQTAKRSLPKIDRWMNQLFGFIEEGQ